MATPNVYLVLSKPMFNKSDLPTAPKRSDYSTDAEYDTAVADISKDPAQAFGTTAKNRAGGIEVLDFSFAVNQIGSEQPGRPRSVERVERSSLTIKKAVDSRSPLLFKYCCQATYIGSAELQVFSAINTTPYIAYRMNYVHVKGYSVSGGSSLPVESIDLAFGEMVVRFDNAGIGGSNQGNSKLGSVKQSWSWVLEAPFQEAINKAIAGDIGGDSVM